MARMAPDVNMEGRRMNFVDGYPPENLRALATIEIWRLSLSADVMGIRAYD